MARQTKQSGFTIIEVVITIAIGAAVMALVLNAVAGARRSQRNNARSSDVNQIAAAINQHIAVRNSLPNDWGQISSLVENLGHYDPGTGTATVPLTPVPTTSAACTAAGGTWGPPCTGAVRTVTTTKSINPAKSLDGTNPTTGGVFISTTGGPTTPANAADGIGAKGSTTGALEAADKIVILQKTGCASNTQIEGGGIREMAIIYRLEGQDNVICLEV